ncbi:UDP-N-acetylglucosamine 2-epimerase [Helicobacter sp. MIT 05-5293]|uniref:UDP-N-acetylglucosamine 2-epimerase n=1 Tax=Helicobacter sp. MIT 05-5293 TaxID=1548149 RepID=UPI000691B69C|nr:UDP-N-acetylglucosamine 2-epimerase [Helicobacter sp. MIT 05-5293]
MKTLLFILGTRPEAIKLAPLILEFKKYPAEYNVIVCNTEQQKELSHQALSFFGLKADICLDVMVENQTLSELNARILVKLQEVFCTHHIDAVFVQGDTMSVFAGSLVAFYFKTKIFHIEAGLRSYDLFEPFPEEAIRQMVSRIATLHFAPTTESAESLKNEGLEEDKIYQVGNTGIDALSLLDKKALQDAAEFWKTKNIDMINGGGGYSINYCP